MENNGSSFSPEATQLQTTPAGDPGKGGTPVKESQYLGFGDSALTSKVKGTSASHGIGTTGGGSTAETSIKHDEVTAAGKITSTVSKSASSAGTQKPASWKW